MLLSVREESLDLKVHFSLQVKIHLLLTKFYPTNLINNISLITGWNRVYPYNTGDLTISAMVLYNYLEANAKVPWEDLRYLFGEIMYGGHITDDWDRKLCRTYLEEYMHPDMVRQEKTTSMKYLYQLENSS